MTALAYLTALTLLQGSPQQPDLPPPIMAGLNELTAGHCVDAFTIWSRDWSGPDNAGKQDQLRASCEVLGRLGKLQGYDVLRIVDVGPHLRRVYLLLRYEAQPVYLMLVAYQAADTWKTITVNWNTVADKVLPAIVAPTERPQP